MLNRYEHEDAEPLAESACADRRAAVRFAPRPGRPRRDAVAYVNDNHGAWEAGREQLVERALAGEHSRPSSIDADPQLLPFVVR